jgi:hypothetical protein
VQLAGDGDDVTDSSVPWPDSRTEVPFGTITVTARVDDTIPERRKISFDPRRGQHNQTRLLWTLAGPEQVSHYSPAPAPKPTEIGCGVCLNCLACEPALQVFRELGGTRVAFLRIFVEALEADRTQVE